MADNFLRHHHFGHMMDSRRKHLPKESAEVRQVQPGVRQGLGPCWEGADDFSCVSVVYLNLYSYLYLCIFPKSQLRLPSATRCEGDLGTMLGSCGWPHRHSVWKAEWHTHYQTRPPHHSVTILVLDPDRAPPLMTEINTSGTTWSLVQPVWLAHNSDNSVGVGEEH